MLFELLSKLGSFFSNNIGLLEELNFFRNALANERRSYRGLLELGRQGQ